MCYCLARTFFVYGPWSVNTAQRMAFHTSGDLRFASVEFGGFLKERKTERKESSNKCKIVVIVPVKFIVLKYYFYYFRIKLP